MSRYTFVNIRRFIADVVNCSRMMKEPLKSYGYLRSGREPYIGQFNYKGLSFEGRKEDWIAIREVLVEDEYSCVKHLLPDEGVSRVLDLGANIGTFALRVFSHNASAHVVSVEAADDTFRLLDANKKHNPGLNWEVMNNGVWSEDGPLTLMRRGISVGHRVIEGAGDEVINGISLHTLVDKLGWESVDLIKMDIEGGEEAVIPSALDILRRARFLIVELHSDRVDIVPLMESLRGLYANHWQLNSRESSKPLYVMTNERIDLSGYMHDTHR